MTIPFMVGGLVFIPKIISYGMLILLVLFGIKEFRQGHIGRLGIAANAFLLWQIFMETGQNYQNGFNGILILGQSLQSLLSHLT